MKRREFVAGGCALCAALWAAAARAQQDWQMPARFVRPELATDEGGLWAMMDRTERRLRRSPFVIRDQALRDYVQAMSCKLAADHCADVRVHLVRTPLFNAFMAPNGMMQVWSGLMLRMENEAQIATVLAHELAHYLERHTLIRLRDAKSASAFGQFIGLFGAVGALGQIAVLAGQLSYSRDQEREADRIGLILMSKAGYDANEAPTVWSNLLAEIKARPDSQDEGSTPMFATHPGVSERIETLATIAGGLPRGATNQDTWQGMIKSQRGQWLDDEIKRGTHEETLVLLTRMLKLAPADAELLVARGEVYRRRAKGQDLDLALQDLKAAVAGSGAPPEAHRSLALVHRKRGDSAQAGSSFKRYLEMAPDAPDAAMIRTYVEELGK